MGAKALGNAAKAFKSEGPFIIEKVDQVLSANAEFYACFELRSLDWMSDIWEHSDEVRCTHPGWPTLRGWGAVSGSFYNLFQSQPGLQFLLSDTEVTFMGDGALVFTTENILGQAVGSAVSALNVFRFDDSLQKWLMIVHHGSPVSALFT